MNDIFIALEAASGEMESAFFEWTEACEALHRTPDLKARLEKANIAHEKFLAARKKVQDLLRHFMELKEEYGH